MNLTLAYKFLIFMKIGYITFDNIMDGGTGSPASVLGTDKQKHKALYCRRNIAIDKNKVE